MRIYLKPNGPHPIDPDSWGYYNHGSRTIWVNVPKFRAKFPWCWRRLVVGALAHELTHWLTGFWTRPHRSVYDVYKDELVAYRTQLLVNYVVGPFPLGDRSIQSMMEEGAIGSTADCIRQLKMGRRL